MSSIACAPRVVLVLTLAAGLVAGCGGPGTDAPAEPEAEPPLAASTPGAEWIDLFDGESLTHWRGFRRDDAPEGWAVVDGAITRVGGGGDLVSREQYANFEFAFEWRVPPGGNSGVMFRVTEDQPQTYHSGPEYQVLDNAGHRDGQDPLTSAASNYALHAPTRDATRPVGEWNEGRLVVDGARVEHWLNGERVIAYELFTPGWEALVAASKFNEWPAYGRAPRGHVVLQDHGDRVAFRHLRIRVLP
jgi:hypothetical protein